MSDADETPTQSRVPPTGDAWRVAQKAMAERNDRAQREGKRVRAEHERKVAALRRHDGLYR